MTSSFPPPPGGFPAPPPEPGLPPALTSQVPVPMAPVPYVFQGAAAGQPPSPAHRVKRSGLEIASIVLTIVALIIEVALTVVFYWQSYGYDFYDPTPILLFVIGFAILVRRRPTSIVLAVALSSLFMMVSVGQVVVDPVSLLFTILCCPIGIITCFAGARMFNGRPVSVSCSLAVAEAFGVYALRQIIRTFVQIAIFPNREDLCVNYIEWLTPVHYNCLEGVPTINYFIGLLLLIIMVVASILSVLAGLRKRSRVLMLMTTIGAVFPVFMANFYCAILAGFADVWGFVMITVAGIVIFLALALMPLRRSGAEWFAGRWEPRVRQPVSHQVAFVAVPVAGQYAGQYAGGQPAPVVGAPVSPQVAALLPSTAPTFWISFFFGLFGLIPMSMANSMAARLGAVTNQYNHAFLKGWLIGMAAWIACYVLVFVLIVSSGY